MKRDIVIIDTETTGLLGARANRLEFQPYIIEIYVLRLNHKLKKVGELDTLIKPPVPIPDFITRLTGISDIMVMKSPSFKKVAKKILNICKGAKTFVAHNASFDYEMICNEFKRIDDKRFQEIDFDFFCTVEEAYAMSGYRYRNLELYTELTWKNFITNQHRAKADVLATLENYKELLKRIN